jgi:hypothetical protein
VNRGCLDVAMKKSENDPVINEIREVRHRISARFDHDPARLVAYYMELQKQYEDRLIKPEEIAEHRKTRPA